MRSEPVGPLAVLLSNVDAPRVVQRIELFAGGVAHAILQSPLLACRLQRLFDDVIAEAAVRGTPRTRGRRDTATDRGAASPCLAGMSIAQHRIAKPQRGFAVERAARQVFRHAFDEPQRLPGVIAVPSRDVELKRVDDLVTEHAIGLGHRRRERHGDAAARRVGDAADRIRKQARTRRWFARTRPGCRRARAAAAS